MQAIVTPIQAITNPATAMDIISPPFKHIVLKRGLNLKGQNPREFAKALIIDRPPTVMATPSEL